MDIEKELMKELAKKEKPQAERRAEKPAQTENVQKTRRTAEDLHFDAWLALIMRQFQEAEELYAEIIEYHKADSKALAKAYYRMLMVRYEVADLWELINIGRTAKVWENPFFDKAYQIGIPDINHELDMVKGVYGHSSQDWLKTAENQLKEKAYIATIRAYKAAGETEKGYRLATEKGKEAMRQNRFEKAMDYFVLAMAYKDNKVHYADAFKANFEYIEFSATYPDPEKTAREYLETHAPEEFAAYRAHSERATELSDYVEGIGYWIAVILSLIGGIGLFFGGVEGHPAAYVVWGIALSVAAHMKFLWDFSFFKSIFGTAALCLVPAWICEETTHLDGMALIIKGVATLIPLIMLFIEMRHASKVRKSKSEGTKANALRAKLEATLKPLQNDVFNKYKDLVEESIARRWAREFNCL